MGLVLGIGSALAGGYGAHQAHEARKDQREAIRKQEAEAATAKQQAEAAAEKKRREGLMRQGMMSTIHTSPFGVNTPAATAKKTLLGQ